MTPKVKLPSLVQRVKFRNAPADKRGIDALFDFDYMGSTEFETGLNPALKAMRAVKLSDSEPWQVRTLSTGAHVSYLVGSGSAVNAAIQLFVDQLKPREEREGYTKERTGIRETYLPEPRDVAKFDGWWSIDEDFPPFILFKNKDHAEAWLGAL
jgi:hypothetical protein